ncbi:ABC transporter ATP-binding protein [Bradyrhizobium sp. Ash2021]|uniref:ABC transporter ATP-binding protein n=1 Tax=Bradyrhizobium sp. Ash2021 TaxID=2954771 RepID=UPI0028168E0C|nr:ABC transporter ATP-binding protein [Bradyrhizobium sp. Ash2021]WMT72091.1 ABC transporter ATP-binding protein [Bradyrhizobium sp. Ash2021]
MTAAIPSRVQFRNVTKRFSTKDVLLACNLDIAPGRFTALLGPSSCGKTTIIDLVAGYESPSEGEILVDGQPVQGPGWDRLVVFPETAVFPWKSTMANVLFGPMNRKARGPDVRRQAGALLAKLGLDGLEGKYPNQLSGGMRRRAELARALINSPKVMLLDQPFRGLDAMTRELMQEYLLRVFEDEPVTTIFVTTEIEEAILLADQTILLTNTPAAVKQVIDVALPRPRNLKMLSSASFGEIQGAVLESFLEEAR